MDFEKLKTIAGDKEFGMPENMTEKTKKIKYLENLEKSFEEAQKKIKQMREDLAKNNQSEPLAAPAAETPSTEQQTPTPEEEALPLPEPKRTDGMVLKVIKPLQKVDPQRLMEQ